MSNLVLELYFFYKSEDAITVVRLRRFETNSRCVDAGDHIPLRISLQDKIRLAMQGTLLYNSSVSDSLYERMD